jgi:hypothetical protein
MKNLLILAAAAALALPTVAQVQGGVNRQIPEVTTKIDYPNGNKVSITYKSINFASGQWMKGLEDQGMRDRINTGAEKNPIGTFETSSDWKIGSDTVKAGKYSLAFKVDAEKNWKLVLFQGEGDKKVEYGFKLAMSESKQNRQFLKIALAPGSQNSAEIDIHFGQMTCNVAATPVEAAKKAEPTPAPGKGNGR